MSFGSQSILRAIEDALQSESKPHTYAAVARIAKIDRSTANRYGTHYQHVMQMVNANAKLRAKQKRDRIKAKVLKQLERGQWSLRTMAKEIGEEETAIRQVVINNGIGINRLGENKRNMRLECAAMTVKAYEKGDTGIGEAFYLECKRELTGQSC